MGKFQRRSGIPTQEDKRYKISLLDFFLTKGCPVTKAKIIKDSFIGSGLSPEEIKYGQARHSEYKKIYPQLNKLSNLQLLEELIWLECLQERFKSQVGLITKPIKGDDGKVKIESIPKHLQESISGNLAQIIELKTKLGLFEDKQVLDAFKYLDAMFKKAAVYRSEHPLDYKVSCPHCTKIFFLKRKTKGYEEFISPFYADDKVLKNTPLHNLYKAGKITKEEEAEVLGVSSDFIDWLDENVYKKKKG